MASKISALSNLLYSLSRLPGLGFLRKFAQVSNRAEYTRQNMTSAKRSAEALKSK